MFTKKQRYSKLKQPNNTFEDDDAVFHDTYNRKKHNTSKHDEHDILDDGDAADESESYQDETNTNNSSTDNNEEDDVSESDTNTDDDSERESKKTSNHKPKRDNHDYYDDDDDLLYEAQSPHKYKGDDEDCFFKCFIVIAFLILAVVIGLLIGVAVASKNGSADDMYSIITNENNTKPIYNQSMNLAHDYQINHNKQETTTTQPPTASTSKNKKTKNKDKAKKHDKQPLVEKTKISKSFEPTPVAPKPVTSKPVTSKPVKTESAPKPTVAVKNEKIISEKIDKTKQTDESKHSADNDVSNDKKTAENPYLPFPDTLEVIRTNPVKQPICPNSQFTANSYNDINSPQPSICNKFVSGLSYLTPSEPDRIVSAYIDCALDNDAESCQTDFGHDYKINIIHGFADNSENNKIEPQMQCVVDEDIFDINIEYGPYVNNDDYMECLRIKMPTYDNNDVERELFLRDYDIYDEDMHSLRVEFTMSMVDVEQGFDNIFLSWQYNDVYHRNFVHWTGNDKKFQSTPGMKSSESLYWNVLSGDYLEICLTLNSDTDITGNGYKGIFKIRQELAIWSNWTQCITQYPIYNIYGGECGVGVRNKKKICPNYDWPQELENNSYDDGVNICNEKETFFNEYCTKRKCENIDNLNKTLVLNQKKKPEKFLKWNYNGVHRKDLTYPDPFRYIISNNKRIDLDDMIQQISDKMKNISSRYSDIRILKYGIGEDINNYDTLKQRVQARLLRSLLLGRRFVVSFTGSSNTAGHDNLFLSTYSMQLLATLRTFWTSIGYHGSSFMVHDAGVGGHLGTKKLRWCVNQLIQKDADFVFWESLMNDAGDKQAFHLFETWLRNVLSAPKNPIWGVISTGFAADRYGDQCFNKPYCKIGAAVNKYWWKTVRPHYADSSDMLFIGARRGCYALQDEVPECTGLSTSWHPGPVGHRLYAETFAYWFLSITLEALQSKKKDINKILKQNNYKPSIELECLLHDIPYNDKINVKLPHPKPKWCGDSCKNAPNFCITSYYPTPQYYHIKNFIVNKSDEWDLNIKGHSPFLWRDGGQESIDDKKFWSTKKIGSTITVRVNVDTCCIVILSPISGVDGWLTQFQFKVDGKNVECKQDNKLAGCLINTNKGKRDLQLIYVNKTSKAGAANIDMIATY